ncbi:MAG: cobyric acid synthase, partial [Planctomycetes bacterium]|nr:cobyric acid synthase [Planctomycetota bacterium]
YEIHCGVSARGRDAAAFELRAGVDGAPIADGACDAADRVWGTYLHGVFDDAAFRHAFLATLRAAKGLPASSLDGSVAVSRRLTGEIDRFADHVAAHVDVQALFARLAAS